MSTMPTPDRPANPELDRRVLTAAQRCLTARLYPSEANLRHRGATGDRGNIAAALDRLIDTGKLELPPWAVEKRLHALSIRDELADRVPAGRPIPAAILSPRMRHSESMPRSEKATAAIRPVDGRKRPCRAESKAYWAAWQSIQAWREKQKAEIETEATSD